MLHRLAIAALRPDLDVHTRQRAYHAFLERRGDYQQPVKEGEQELLFEVPLDFALPASLYSLSAVELLLVQFNPRCTSPDEADAAARLFLELASNTIDNDNDDEKPLPTPTGLRVERCELKWPGGQREEDGGLSLEVREDALSVDRRGETLLKVKPTDIKAFRYLAGADDGQDAMQCTLEIDAVQIALNPVVSVQNAQAKLSLGMLSAKDGRFIQLRAAVGRWGRERGFVVSVAQATNDELTKVRAKRSPPQAPTGYSPSLDTRSGGRSRSATTEGTTPVLVPQKRRTSLDYSESKRRRRSEASLELQTAGEGLWSFVGEAPADTEWHPGALVRQFALLQAIAPNECIEFPDFSPDELTLLSREPLLSRLPKLPSCPDDPALGRKHLAIERLALEHIYHKGPPLNLASERFVILANEYPDLRAYAQLISKLVTTRDALKVAYEQVLQNSLYARSMRRGADTRDLVDRLAEIVTTMRDNPLYRRRVLLDCDGKLIRRPPFSATDLGAGPCNRFDMALQSIVEYEADARAVG